MEKINELKAQVYDMIALIEQKQFEIRELQNKMIQLNSEIKILQDNVDNTTEK